MLVLNKLQELEDTLKSCSRVVVDFFTDTCVPCKIMEPVLVLMEGLERNKSITFVKFNAETDEDLSKYGVRAVPTILGFVNGSEVMRQVGSCSQNALESKIDGVL
jgi:thioredoxin 1